MVGSPLCWFRYPIRPTRLSYPTCLGFRCAQEAGEELKAKCGNDFETFFGDFEVAPEPTSSITGKQSDGLGGYDAAGYEFKIDDKVES